MATPWRLGLRAIDVGIELRNVDLIAGEHSGQLRLSWRLPRGSVWVFVVQAVEPDIAAILQ